MVTMTLNKVKHKTGLHHRDSKSGNLHMFGYHKLRERSRGYGRFSALMHQRIDASGVDYLLHQSTDI